MARVHSNDHAGGNPSRATTEFVTILPKPEAFPRRVRRSSRGDAD